MKGYICDLGKSLLAVAIVLVLHPTTGPSRLSAAKIGIDILINSTDLMEVSEGHAGLAHRDQNPARRYPDQKTPLDSKVCKLCKPARKG